MIWRIACCVALMVSGLAAVPAGAQSTVSFPVALPDGQPLTLTAKLFRPAGDEPRPAVVLMHGCGGVSNATRRWPAVLNGWGYAALMVDSFGGRGVKEVCTGGTRPVNARDRAFDIAGATTWLKTQSFVRAERIAVIGQSHGGAATLFATLKEDGDRRPLPEPGFAAAVAFYPDCTLRGRTEKRFDAQRPTMILIGDKDDWTLSQRCHELLPRLTGAPVSLHTYPDALHGFDSVGLVPRFRPEVRNRNKPGGCCGAWIGYDEAAYRDARGKVDAFLRQHLERP
ncbi:MAG: dienelactone hydrolase family protein [Alphaproteobacteria bacterium]|nr:dienelactone hydrolase family protein [Alphaproteobacteria bacterium]